jgi:hypothetical protein
MGSSDPVVQSLLHKNAEWAKAVVKVDADFFERSAKGQSPQVSLCLFFPHLVWLLTTYIGVIFLLALIGVVDWLF